MEMILIIKKTVANRDEAIAFAKLIKHRMTELINGPDQIIFTINSKETIDIRSEAVPV